MWRRGSRAFTLIEAMVTVAVIGILALLSVVAYRGWIRSAYMAEAHDMVSHIRGAEEAYHAENGVYLNVSGGLEGHLYPADPAGAFKTAWGAPCGTCVYQWTALNVQPQAPTAFVYAVQADNTGASPPALVLTSTPQPNLTPLIGSPWYIIEAQGDINGDGIFTRVYGFSSTPDLLIDNEGN
jgi:prepilin-type N-terminal cleavage/methylation domain-containing protein